MNSSVRCKFQSSIAINITNKVKVGSYAFSYFIGALTHRTLDSLYSSTRTNASPEYWFNTNLLNTNLHSSGF